MAEFIGKSVCKGVAIGRIKFYSQQENTVVREKVGDASAEQTRYEQARDKAIEELNALYEKAVTTVGEDNAEIFNVHAMMLEDEDYNDSVISIIAGQQVNAEYAVVTERNILYV